MTSSSGRENHLAGETSPYLLQHSRNPVDWYPWGPGALSRAKAEDKPIFLSIGYAACHWCHVMERESFESDAIASLLNASFVAIKVDREERPDLDEIYMTAVQMLTGQGGWPLSVFLTPDGKPFFGGTYFPPEDRYGRPGFASILARVRDAWSGRREGIAAQAAALTEALAATPPVAPAGRRVGVTESRLAAADLAARFDHEWGGFGGAPKFPPHGALALLLREHAASGEAEPRRMVETTLDRMASGGMFDQIGGGFARYSVDERWLVPHFEKMLYDQALIVPVYVDAWRVTRKPFYRRVVEQTLDFVRRELTGPDGELWASLDADSEGHEGRFYVWTPDEVARALGPEDGAFAAAALGIGAVGNFEGKSVAHLPRGPIDEAEAARLAPLRERLRQARESRERPATDDKVLTAWNGLMISAFARAHQAFGREEDLRSARRAADFATTRLTSGDRLLVSWRRGRAHLNAYLDDYAFLARGLLDLYESSFDRRDLDRAARLARMLPARFGDGAGGFYFTSDDHEALLTRTRSSYDGALPSGAGVAAEVLLRLGRHLDDRALAEAGERTLAAAAPLVGRMPSAFASLLHAAAYAEGSVVELAIVGPRDAPETRALLDVAGRCYAPARTIAAHDPADGPSDLPLLRGKAQVAGRAAAYVCRNYACASPTTDPRALAAALGEGAC